MPTPITNDLIATQNWSIQNISLPNEPAAAPNFGELLQQAVGRGVAMQSEADLAIMQSLSGGDITQVEVLSAVKKADLAMRMMLQVRNKLLDAYNEIQQIRF